MMLPEAVYNLGIIIGCVGLGFSFLILIVLKAMKRKLQAGLKSDYGAMYCEAKKHGK